MKGSTERVVRAWIIVVLLSVFPIMGVQEIQATTALAHASHRSVERINSLEKVNKKLIVQNRRAIVAVKEVQAKNCLGGQVIFDAARDLVLEITTPLPETGDPTIAAINTRKAQERADLYQRFGFGNAATRPKCP